MKRPTSLHSALAPADVEGEARQKAKMRRRTACQTARDAVPGLVERCTAKRDDERQVLTVTIRWREHATDHQRRVGTLKIESALRYWAWEGWVVEVEGSTSPSLGSTPGG